VLAELRFDGATVLVSGAGSGIGRACAEVFAELGASLILVGRRLEPLRETEALLERFGGQVSSFAADVGDEQSVLDLRDAVQAQSPALKALVNNAGYNVRGSMSDASVASWSEVLGVNLTSIFSMTKHFLPLLLAAPKPAVVNVASIFGLRGTPGQAAYSTAKGGIISLTRQLAVEYGPQGLRVNAISPGSIATPRILGAAGAGARGLDESIRLTPLGRIGTAHEVANFIAFMASDAAAFLHGENIVVDGGRTIVV
jgi:NAD(P)-dependent dehydrogenase (short-subunit alcohol dehydrogenase family)